MILIGVIVFLFATIFGFISLGIAWEKCSKNWAICAILCGILTFIGCFIKELCLPAIGFGVILLFVSYFPLTESDGSPQKSYSYNKKKTVQRINDLYNKKLRLDQEIYRLKREQINLINQFEQENNGQVILPTESKIDMKSEDKNAYYGIHKM